MRINTSLGGVALNFKDRTLVAPSVITVIALALMVATLLYAVFVPEPSAQGIARGPQAQLRSINRDIDTLRAQQERAARIVAARVWTGSQNDVSAAVLASLTARAKQDGLAISSFRPQRATDLSGVTELPFNVQLSGPYPGVRRMMSSLDVPATRIVLRSAQITAAANSPADVTAALGLSAYLAADPAILAAATAPGSVAIPSTAITETTSMPTPKARAERPVTAPASQPKKGTAAHDRS